MFLGFRFLVWIPSFFIASGRGTWKEKISTPILELCLCSSDQKSKLDYKSKERCSKCPFKSFFQSQRSNSKKHCILFEQNHELFQGEFYRNKEVGKGFCWCKLNSFSNTSVGPQINSTSLKEKKHCLAIGHTTLNWTGCIWSLIPFPSQLGIIFRSLFWKARMQIRGKIVLSLQTGYANQINTSKLFRTEASHHNQRGICSYKQFCTWYRFRVSKFMSVEKMIQKSALCFLYNHSDYTENIGLRCIFTLW